MVPHPRNFARVSGTRSRDSFDSWEPGLGAQAFFNITHSNSPRSPCFPIRYVRHGLRTNGSTVGTQSIPYYNYSQTYVLARKKYASFSPSSCKGMWLWFSMVTAMSHGKPCGNRRGAALYFMHRFQSVLIGLNTVLPRRSMSTRTYRVGGLSVALLLLL
jgi:hypothetical protein